MTAALPAARELFDRAEIVLARIAQMRLQLEPANQTVRRSVHRVGEQYVLRPEQVLPFPEPVALREELLSAQHRPLTFQSFEPTNDPLRRRDVPAEIRVVPAGADDATGASHGRSRPVLLRGAAPRRIQRAILRVSPDPPLTDRPRPRDAGSTPAASITVVLVGALKTRTEAPRKGRFLVDFANFAPMCDAARR
jgi:hypothetical protein